MASITANERVRADAALVRRFRQAQTKRERMAAFADLVRQHRDAVLGCCTERLWPDADAAVAAAGDVLIAACLAMADPAKLARPERLRSWLLGIAAHDGLTSGLPARIDDINWDAVQAHVAADDPDMPDLPANRAWLRRWLEQIVGTLPEPRQRLYDLCVARGLDSRTVALELGTNVAEVRRLRRDNRQAILRAFEVTALAADQAAAGHPGSEAPGCRELQHILADAQHGGGPHDGGRRHIVVLPAALRLTVTRHLSQCRTCQHRCDDFMAWWAPELLPILASPELNEQVMDDLHLMPQLARPHTAPGAHRRAASAGVTGMVVARRAVVGMAGAGLLVALLVLGFVWPGFLHSASAIVAQGDSASSSQVPGNGGPQVAGTTGGASGSARPSRSGAAGPLATPAPQVTGNLAAPSSSASVPPAVYTVLPSTSAPSPSLQPTSGSSRSSSSSAAAPSSSASKPTQVASAPATSAAPTAAPTSAAPTASPTSPDTSTPVASTPAPSTSDSTSAPAPQPSVSATDPSATLAPSTPPSS